MSQISLNQQIQAKRLNAQETKHVFEQRKLRQKLTGDLESVKQEHENTVKRMRKEYDKKELDEKNSLQAELVGIRRKNEIALKAEKQKNEDFIRELKQVHESKVTELKTTQQQEMQQYEQEHKDYLDNLENKYETERTKLEA